MEETNSLTRPRRCARTARSRRLVWTPRTGVSTFSVSHEDYLPQGQALTENSTVRRTGQSIRLLCPHEHP